MASDLVDLHAEIDARVGAIRDAHPEWPCSKGCDNCCRRLAEIPILTEAEWRLLRQGLAALPDDQLRAIRLKVVNLAQQSTRPLVCPMLDLTSGACPVYAQRPVACRSYGYYLQRDTGLYCRDIEARVAAGELADVVWGNHDAVERRLHATGDARPLTVWFQNWFRAEAV